MLHKTWFDLLQATPLSRFNLGNGVCGLLVNLDLRQEQPFTKEQDPCPQCVRYSVVTLYTHNESVHDPGCNNIVSSCSNLQTVSVRINSFLNYFLNFVFVDATINSSIKHFQQYTRPRSWLVWVTVIEEGQVFTEMFCFSSIKCYLKIW